mmetsp:Transcript_33783/g.86651  ORF Transcript_33783/g.86651 Transcript_33783/m.86651 type:complete len:124 (-) Transcript_33783:506-877(-)
MFPAVPRSRGLLFYSPFSLLLSSSVKPLLHTIRDSFHRFPTFSQIALNAECSTAGPRDEKEKLNLSTCQSFYLFATCKRTRRKHKRKTGTEFLYISLGFSVVRMCSCSAYGTAKFVVRGQGGW